jgi:hypothetical protein
MLEAVFLFNRAEKSCAHFRDKFQGGWTVVIYGEMLS